MENSNLYGVFLAKAEQHGDRVFLRRKTGGGWQDVSWNDVARMTDRIAIGLLKLGVKKGEAVCILSDNCVEWIASDLAIVSIGAVTTAIYASNTPDECAYIINHCEARVLIAEDCEQYGKIRQVRKELPGLEHAVIFSPTGVTEPPGLWSLEQLMACADEENPRLREELAARRASVHREDLLTYIYTSGTTGPPKGVMLTHGNALYICESYANMGFVKKGDNSLSILPMAHALERLIFYITMSLGGHVSISDDIYSTAQYLLDVHPTILICVPRVLEKAYERVQAKACAAPPVQKKLFAWAVETGRQAAQLKHHGQPLPASLALKHFVADSIVFKKIRKGLGGNLRFIGCGGAPLSPEIVEFFCSVGIPVVQGWGMTETSAPATQMPLDAIRYDSVGKAIKDVELKVADDGELLVRGPGIFNGYLKNPKDTEATLIDGWCHTGDLGEIDEEGYVKITGRKKELIITAGGKNISPLNLEFLFMSGRYINQAVVIGDSRPFLTALFTLNLEEIHAWSASKGIDAGETPIELHPKVREIVSSFVEEKNATLPRYMTIKKFAIIPGEFTHEGGELTPTMKTKKSVIFKKYESLIEEMYAE